MLRTLVVIDGEKLRAELNRRGLALQTTSKEMGFSGTYLNQCVTRGTISKNALVTLKQTYNIQPDDIAVEREEPKPEKSEAVLLNYDELYKTIYCAVYEAVKKAWAE